MYLYGKQLHNKTHVSFYENVHTVKSIGAIPYSLTDDHSVTVNNELILKI